MSFFVYFVNNHYIIYFCRLLWIGYQIFMGDHNEDDIDIIGW